MAFDILAPLDGLGEKTAEVVTATGTDFLADLKIGVIGGPKKIPGKDSIDLPGISLDFKSQSFTGSGTKNKGLFTKSNLGQTLVQQIIDTSLTGSGFSLDI